MDGLLNSIRGLFKKKKDEEEQLNVPSAPIPNLQLSQPKLDLSPAKVAATSAQPTGNNLNLSDLFGSISSNLGKFGQDLTQKVASIPLTPKKIYWQTGDVTELPGQINVGDVARFAKEDVLQPGLRLLPETAMTISDALADKQSKSRPIPVEGKVNQFLFGEKPLTSFQTQYGVNKKAIEDFGVSPKYSPYISLAGLAVAKPLDILPGVDDALLKGGKKIVQKGVEKTLAKEGIEKLTLESADDVISAIKNEFKINPVNIEDTAEPIKLNLKKVEQVLSDKYNVAKNLLSNVFKDKGVTEGEGYIMQRQGDQLVANVFDGFKDTLKPKVELPSTLPKPLQGINLGADIKVKPEGVELPKPEFKVKFNSPQQLVSELDNAAAGGKRPVDSLYKTLETKGDEVYPDRVEEYIQKIRAGEPIDPIIVNTKGEVLDGGHRLTAMKQLGVKDADVIVEGAKGEKLFYDIEKAPTKTEFNKTVKEAQKTLNEDYGLVTPEQLERKRVKTSKMFEREADKQFESETIDLAGKGDIQVPPEILKTFSQLKDKEGPFAMLSFNRETPLRNIEEVAGESAPVWKDFFFGRVAQDTQNINNFVSGIKNDIRSKVIDSLGIKPGSDLDALVMKYGEKKMTLDELKAATDQWQNVVQADAYFRGLYDNLLTQINDTITQYGYEAVPKRQNYYTHFQELGGIFDMIGNLVRTNELPTNISGLTADFKPGKQFFKFAQPRLGEKTVESAIGSVDRYLPSAANQIFRTETIQRGRALERVMLEAIEKDNILKKEMLEQGDNSKYFLNNFMAWYRDYLNTIAGKKSLMDRGTEGLIGRSIYSTVKWLKQRTAANMVVGNISSALTNFIPLTQSIATTKKSDVIKGLINATLHPLTEANGFTIDGIQSQFLRNRFPEGKLAMSWGESAADKLSWLFQSIDKFTSNSIVAGKYFENLEKNLSPEEAMKMADDYASRIMADRSFGQLPQVLQNQGLVSLFTQFQTEINNQVSFMVKDIPNMSEGSKVKLASMLGQIAIYSWLYNNINEKLTGRRPAFDPIDAVATTMQEAYSTDTSSQKLQTIAKVWADNLPFTQILTGGGRIPILAGMPSIQEVQDNPILGIAAPIITTYGLPGGGGQIKKTIEGVSDYRQGMATDRSGKVKYLIEQDLPNLIRAVVAGKYSFPEAQKFFEEGADPQSVKESILLKNLQAQDPAQAQAVYTDLLKTQEIQTEVRKITAGKDKLKLIIGDPKLSDDYKRRAIQVYQENAQRIMREVQQKLVEMNPEQADTINNSFEKANQTIQESNKDIVIPKLNKLPTKNILGNVGVSGGSTKVSTKGVSLPKLSLPKSTAIKLPTVKSKSTKATADLTRVKSPTTKKSRGVSLAERKVRRDGTRISVA